ncbi:MAG: roadblock/LC7 domain-containing protein [Candidatus Hodarchaeota archaeon]
MSHKMLDQCNLHLQSIKAVPGVENSVLAQRDGYPITSSGVWLSENEIFGLSSSAAAILSVAQRLHDDLSYVLIEGERSKFLLATLPRASNYFITVTTQSQSNLGALLLQLERTIRHLDESLWNEHFIPPLRAFENREKAQIYNAFNVREGPQRTWTPSTVNLSITESTAQQITEIVMDFLQALPSAETGEVCLEGGYLIPTQRYNEGVRIRNSTLTYTLFDTSRKVAQLVKRTRILQVLCDCGNQQHFIYRLAGGLFSTLIKKDSMRLGLLRLVIPNFISEIESVLQKAPTAQRPTLDVNGFLEAIAR